MFSLCQTHCHVQIEIVMQTDAWFTPALTVSDEGLERHPGGYPAVRCPLNETKWNSSLNYSPTFMNVFLNASLCNCVVQMTHWFDGRKASSLQPALTARADRQLNSVLRGEERRWLLGLVQFTHFYELVIQSAQKWFLTWFKEEKNC